MDDPLSRERSVRIGAGRFLWADVSMWPDESYVQVLPLLGRAVDRRVRRASPLGQFHRNPWNLQVAIPNARCRAGNKQAGSHPFGVAPTYRTVTIDAVVDRHDA